MSNIIATVNPQFKIRKIIGDIAPMNFYNSYAAGVLGDPNPQSVPRFKIDTDFIPIAYYAHFFDLYKRTRAMMEGGQEFGLLSEDPDSKNVPLNYFHSTYNDIWTKLNGVDFSDLMYEAGVWYIPFSNLMQDAIDAMDPGYVDLKVELTILVKV